MKTVLIFLPNTLKPFESGYLEGFLKESDDCVAFYVTGSDLVKKSDKIIGYVGKVCFKKGFYLKNLESSVVVNYGGCASENVVKITYDYSAFKSCDPLLINEENYGGHFEVLSGFLHGEASQNGAFFAPLLVITAFFSTLLKVLLKVDYLRYSATISHFFDGVQSAHWLLQQMITEKRISARVINFLIAKLCDLFIGILVLNWLLNNEDYVVTIIDSIKNTIIDHFDELSKYLMGSPIGLKLNKAFNRSLGTFFFYHFALWTNFLDVMQPMLKDWFKVLVLPGAFGFSYQIAMLSDLISLATFHVYCIYVYAARLICLQLRGLSSLWRLFIGRKYNPLRERVDSHQYTHNQLFIGTLGFTILLFLFPTSAMYYTVFTIFRVAMLLVEEILCQSRQILHCFPIYITVLWITRSPNITGPVSLKWIREANFEATLQTLPLTTSISRNSPEIHLSGSNRDWSLICNKIFMGVLV